jgi:hypothetical protein
MASLNWRRLPAEIVNFIDIVYHPVEGRCPRKAGPLAAEPASPRSPKSSHQDRVTHIASKFAFFSAQLE